MAERDLYLGLHPELTHPYFFCGRCEHYFQPSVTTELLLSFYQSAIYYRASGSGWRAALDRLRQRNRARSIEWRARKGRALDIGCGRGLVLEQLRQRGWEVAGMDWNAENARAVADRLQVSVAAGADGLASFDAESFDAVSMFHVLEHEQQPLDLLRSVHRLLKPGGRLLVGVPNSNSTARHLFGRHWTGYDFSRHRHVFSPRSLEAALRVSGFFSERSSTRFSDELLDLEGSARLMLRSRGSSSSLLLAAITLCAAVLVCVPRLFGQNSVMYAYARKR
jgi:SAM-dependent methyltransferase